jgi:hypothetical protein
MADEDDPVTGDELTGDERDDDTHQDDDDAQTYPARVVRDLRNENAKHRTRAKDAEARAEELGRALFISRVEATGKVENAAEIPYNADILDDPDAIAEAVDAAIAERPYIAKRKVQGSIGQGERGRHVTAPQDFSALLRG